MVIAVQVRNLTKEYGRKLVLNDVSFDVQQGEIFGIIGMSGSGKTTLLNHLIGFIEADEGEVKYHSSRVFKEKTHKELRGLRRNLQDVKRMFGFAPQAPSFYPRLTVKENLLHFGALHKVDSKIIHKNMEHLLALTQLEEHQNKLGEHLSGGQQRRLSIMCGLIHKPEVLILDEPTADLDPVLRDETWRLIRAINKLGTTVIVASHLLEELEKACDRVAIIDEGRLIQYGSIQAIEDKYSHHTIEIRIDTTPEYIKILQDRVHKRNVQKMKREEGRIRIYTKNPRDTLYEIARMIRSGKVRVHSLEVHRPHLREVFSEITHK
jgi:ABC-2 type transport system ATP-binding protein